MSTGNAKRDLRQGLVNIAPTTIKIPPGKRDVKEIISSIKHGYYVRDVQGAHSSNPESGDFSIVGNPAVLIENGELKGAINGLMVSGNIYELLRNVVEIASEPRNSITNRIREPAILAPKSSTFQAHTKKDLINLPILRKKL